MIGIKNLTMSFGNRIIFEDVNFIINPGEKIGLIGRNGSGKSTFMKLMMGKIEPEEGSVELPEFYNIGYLEQHIHFTHPTVIDEVCSVLNVEREHEAWKGESILTGLGFSYEEMQKNPSEFSGGYQVKINLAKILLTEPDMLLLDEPTNYLDIYSIRWLGDFLKKWRNELILITHDRGFMDSVITHTVIIHRGNFRKIQGKTGKIKEQIAMEEEIYEKTRVSEEKKRKETEDWIRRFGAKASKASAVQSRVKMLEKQEVKEKLPPLDAIEFKFHYLPFGSKDYILEAENLRFGYNENNILIDNLSFKVNANDKICIIGKNGNGKSTLLKLLVSEINPLVGSVKMNDKAECGYFGQMNIERLDKNNTICEELEKFSPSTEYNAIRRICSNMLFGGENAFKKIGVLSGGEKSRVMLAKILLSKVNLLLLDEPTNHFDIESAESLMEAIKNFEGAVLMITHDEYFLREIATKLIVFDGGKTFCFEGGYDDFLKKVGWSA